MKDKFYQKEYDDATMLKLEIFKRYLREWLPVFMEAQKRGRSPIERINICDFFAGPGKDKNGNPGSPLIIVEEIKRYCSERGPLKQNVNINMLFNDIEEKYVNRLQKEVGAVACDDACCDIKYSAQPFLEALTSRMSELTSHKTANLIIMDQFGVTEVTPEIVNRLSLCEATDILFFISTSFIKRFIETPEIGAKYDLDPEKMKNIDYNVIHRCLCDYFKEKLTDRSYYLAPFSIKKGVNIYGIIFGTSHLLGLEKFLKVCWSLDEKTGEANYNIDRDFTWDGGGVLFDEYSHISKISLFETNICNYISDHKPDNIELNEFCLLNGFAPQKANEILSSLQDAGRFYVWDIKENKRARKKSFYLGWTNCKAKIARVRYLMEMPT